jgi:hypothetical protein
MPHRTYRICARVKSAISLLILNVKTSPISTRTAAAASPDRNVIPNRWITNSVKFAFQPGVMGSCSSPPTFGPYERHKHSSLPHMWLWKAHSRPSTILSLILLVTHFHCMNYYYKKYAVFVQLVT